MAANKNISNATTSSFQPQLENVQNRHYENRIRELEAENTRLKDKLAVDEIKLNLVMSCETQFMSPSMTKTLSDLKSKLAEKESAIGQLRKRLRSEEHRSQNQTLQRDAGEAVVDLCEAHFQCAVCNELLVKATGLQCGHVFCRDCVNKWKKKSESSADLRGKKATCPICRSEIATQAPLKNIDAFLEKAVEIFFTDEAKKSRKELLTQATTGSPVAGTSSSDAAFLRYAFLSGGLNRPPSSSSTRHRIQRGANRSPPFVILDDD